MKAGMSPAKPTSRRTASMPSAGLGHLLQADAVDRVDREVGGGFVAHQRLVHLQSAGVARQPAFILGLGAVFVGHEVAQPLDGGQHLPIDRGGALAPQVLARGFGDARAQPLERFEVVAGLAAPGKLRVQLLQHHLQHAARRHPALRHAGAQVGDLLLHAQRVRSHAREDLARLHFGRHRRSEQQVAERGLERPRRGVHRHRLVAGEGLHGQRSLELPREDLDRQAVLRTQLLFRQRGQPCQHLARQAVPAPAPFARSRRSAGRRSGGRRGRWPIPGTWPRCGPSSRRTAPGPATAWPWHRQRVSASWSAPPAAPLPGAQSTRPPGRPQEHRRGACRAAGSLVSSGRTLPECAENSSPPRTCSATSTWCGAVA